MAIDFLSASVCPANFPIHDHQSVSQSLPVAYSIQQLVISQYRTPELVHPTGGVSVPFYLVSMQTRGRDGCGKKFI